MQTDHRRHQRQAVRDTMVHLLHHHFRVLFGLYQQTIGLFLRLAQAMVFQCLLDGCKQKRKEVVPDILDDVVGSTRLERVYGDLGLVGPRHIENWRPCRYRLDRGKKFHARRGLEIVIENDNIELPVSKKLEAGSYGGGMNHLHTVTTENAAGKPRQSRVVIDIQNAQSHHAFKVSELRKRTGRDF
ncbi:hypothetical protein D3C71_1129660 [compost metagenome]